MTYYTEYNNFPAVIESGRYLGFLYNLTDQIKYIKSKPEAFSICEYEDRK